MTPDRHRAVNGAAFIAVVGWAFSAPFSLPAGRAMLAVALLLMIVDLVRRRRAPVITGVSWWALFFIGIACVATVRGVNPALGCPKLRKLIWFIGIPVAATVVSDSRRLRAVMTAFVAGASLLALELCILNPLRALAAVRAGTFCTFTDALINEGSMTDGQRLALGIVAALALMGLRSSLGSALKLEVSRKTEGDRGLPWSLTSNLRADPDRWLALAAGLQAVALVMNFKRGSWICAFLAVAVLMALKANWKSLFILAAVLVLTVLLPPVRVRLHNLRDEFGSFAPGRLTMWCKIAPALIKKHPWGVGYRSLTNDMMREIAPEVEADRDHLHSNIFQVLVATGWLGLAVYLVWMALAVRDSWRFRRLAQEDEHREKTLALGLFMMLSVLLANGLIEYNLGDAELVLLYGLILGSAAAGIRRRLLS